MPYDNEKKFALFKNDKGDNAKRPDYRGTVTIDGVDYKLSGWIAESPKAGKYIRGSVEIDTKGARQAPAPQPETETRRIMKEADDESVPF